MSSTFSLRSLVEFLRVGVVTNWWGLGCPQHCGPSSIPALIFAFCSGLGFGLFLGLVSFLFIAFRLGFLPYPAFFRSSEAHSYRPDHPAHPRASSRLSAYLHG